MDFLYTHNPRHTALVEHPPQLRAALLPLGAKGMARTELAGTRVQHPDNLAGIPGCVIPFLIRVNSEKNILRSCEISEGCMGVVTRKMTGRANKAASDAE